MPATVPANDTERVPLSGPYTLRLFVAYPALWVGTMAGLAVAALVSRRLEAPLGAALLALLLLAALIGWRYATPLRGVVATRTGLIVTGLRDARFVPYQAVVTVQENRLQRGRPVTVSVREPDGGLSRFVFLPSLRTGLALGLDGVHPSVAELLRRLPRPR